jgi:hypothetical protein
VDDAPAAREALLAAGFVSADRLEHVAESFYHVDPVELPGVPLPIELHKSFRWPNGLRAAPNEELFDAAVPAVVDVPGLLAPGKAHHAVLLAGHAWAERRLTRLRDLIDVKIMSERIGRDELARIARGWGWDRLWRATAETIDWFFEGGRAPSAVRVWARHLDPLREPTTLDRERAYWLSPFWALPPHRAAYIVAFFAKERTLGRTGTH